MVRVHRLQGGSGRERACVQTSVPFLAHQLALLLLLLKSLKLGLV